MTLNRTFSATSIATVLLFSLVPINPAASAGAFANFSGSWSGSGRMTLEGGRSESMRCRANYTDRSGGNSLGISLRCASASNRIALRANLAASGNRVSGTWEESEFNVGGRASGSASGNNISLSIQGGLSGSMSVTTNGARQSVNISTQGVALKGIQIGLARD